MRRRTCERRCARYVAVLVTGLAFASTANAAQNTAAIPDLSGFWGRNSLAYETPETGLGPIENIQRLPSGARDRTTLVGDYNNPILKPETAETVKRFGAISLTGRSYPDPQTQCWPQSPPFILRAPATQIIQTPSQILILYQADHQYRRVRLNESHASPVKLSWYGDSVGHFEGDTLVVDTVGIRFGAFSMIDRFGTPYSEKLHLVERFRLIDLQAAKAAMGRNERENGRLENATADPKDTGKGLQIHFTVEDPGVFTAPWSATVTYLRNIDPWVENVCAENLHNYGVAPDPKLPVAETPDF